METLEDLIESMVQLKLEETINLIRVKLKTAPAEKILSEGLAVALERVGRKFESEEYFLAEMLFAAHIMKECMKILEPELRKSLEFKARRGLLVIGTVKGDVHDIGKNIFITLMKASGFDVIDLGVDVGVEKFVQTVEEYRPNFLGMSTLLSTTAPYFKSVTEALEVEKLRKSIFVMIGGPAYLTAEEANADIYCGDAFQGLKKSFRTYGSRLINYK